MENHPSQNQKLMSNGEVYSENVNNSSVQLWII
jgi:hypothetical protein